MAASNTRFFFYVRWNWLICSLDCNLESWFSIVQLHAAHAPLLVAENELKTIRIAKHEIQKNIIPYICFSIQWKLLHMAKPSETSAGVLARTHTEFVNKIDKNAFSSSSMFKCGVAWAWLATVILVH